MWINPVIWDFMCPQWIIVCDLLLETPSVSYLFLGKSPGTQDVMHFMLWDNNNQSYTKSGAQK